MPDVNADFLADMSVQELVALQARIHEAVRARIRERNQAKAPPPAPPAPKSMDLAKERDAWLAARRGLGTVAAKVKP